MSFQSKHFACFCLFWAFCHILWKQGTNNEDVLLIASRYINNASFSSQRQAQYNHTVEDRLERKSVKQCFRLSFKFQTLEALAKIKMIDSDGKGTEQNTELLKTRRVEKLYSKNDSKLCTRFVTLAFYRGRMGNQMFDIASLIGLAHMYDVIPVIPSRLPLNKYFDLPNRINTKVTQLSNVRKCMPGKSAVFYNCAEVFSSKTNTSVYGHLQSWRYFVNACDHIRTIFKFKSKHLIKAKRFLSSVSIDGYQRVCVHVRRGDFATKRNADKGHVIAGLDYIEKAKTFFTTKYTQVQFLVVSDDKPWCRKNLKGVIISPLKNPGDEMALMKLCDHVITTVGTYGWWGAWLSGGTTVYFDKYPRPGSRLASRTNKEDHFPPTWIGIS